METTPTKGAGLEAGIASPTADNLGRAVQAASPPKQTWRGFDLPRPKALTRRSWPDERFSFSNDGCGT